MLNCRKCGAKNLHIETLIFFLSVLCVISVRSGSRVFSSVSVKSDQSKEGEPPEFSEKTPSSPTKRYFMCFTL